MKYYMGIDIGGTSVKAGIIDRDGQVIYKTLVHTPPLDSGLAFTDNIWATAEKVKQVADEKGLVLSGIGVSSAGQIDSQSGEVIGACGNIDNWIGTKLKATLEEMFGLPTVAANDANCALLAECWLGNGAGHQHVVAYTIGTGIGGGILVDGKLLGGKRGIAGEIGHMIIHTNGELCSCGNHGCFEKYGSMRNFVRHVENQTEQTGLNGKLIFSRAEQGDEAFQRYIDEFLDLHADAITGFVHLFNPEAVIIGGGISAQGENVMKPLREKVLKRIMPAFAEGLILTTAKLSNDAGMIGAVKNLLDSLN